MGCKIKRIVSVLCLVAALGVVALLPVSGYCENLRFVFLADSPVGTPPSNPAPADLINTAVLTPIITQILLLSPRPSFVVFGGDQATSGGYNGANYTFEAFKGVMAPLTNAGIKLYTALGNRELFNPSTPLDDTFYLANQTQYQQAFTDNSNPPNGPPGYEQLVYSFESPEGDAFFAVLDPYYLNPDTGDVPNPDLSGTFDDTQITWLAGQVAQTKATHKFLFMHAPYYYVTSEGEGGSPDTTYTNLWRILDNNRFDLCCCAHVHLFSRKAIDISIAPNPPIDPPVQWHNNVVQVINGGAGAPIVTNPPNPPTVDPTLWHISQAPNTYYFTVVDINGSQVTVTSYSYNSITLAWNVFDSFTINKNATPAINSLLLLD